eukprot:TRINITY_DN1797_c0_g1_i1.p1 TRINITY_DN1797_c0_g1~~TRINITY_DN1797_c0_g1_i1.p1  ORF type:complete len:505 (+),score=223.77 TRINITY_DN1797_c0_g1_i1:159-1517(+)
MDDTELVEEIENMLEKLNHELGVLDIKSSYAHECIAPRCRPMVLLIGNHSSGKSTFINNICDAKIQEVGNAPIDDAFTVIQAGDVEITENGYSAVSECEGSSKGFEGLKAFGQSFIQHFKLKVVPVGKQARLQQGVVLVDSPGTIDTPTPDLNRGYDFNKVVRWFVRRSAVILLFFDPANPGTTGETLEILKETLQDSAHKFLIVLNKVDTLDNVGDFARAYGTLCWNLSKVLTTKDIPRVYTMYNETKEAKSNVSHKQSVLPMDEFENAREQVLNEIKLAPERHHDNAVQTIDEVTKKLLMLFTVCRMLPYWPPQWAWMLLSATSSTSLVVSLLRGARSWVSQLLGAAAAVAGVCTLIDFDKLSERNLDRAFEKSFRDNLRNKGDVDVRNRWNEVKAQMLYLNECDEENLILLYKRRALRSIQTLREIQRTELPRLRALVERRRRNLAGKK